MKRFAYSQLLNWKSKESDHFLLLGGVTGVGKTRLVSKFANTEFDDHYYHNLEKIEDNFEEKIKLLKSDSLVIVDNLFGNKDLLLYFKKISIKYSNLYFILIDSYAKVGKGKNQSIAVNYLVLYPLSFEEFLFNINSNLYTKLASLKSVQDIDKQFNEDLIHYFNHYIIVGGMPASIEIYQKHGLDFDLIRNSQYDILENIYQKLGAFYKTTEIKNLKKIILSLYPTIIRENRKFKLTDISTSIRFVSFKKYFEILSKLNIIYISPLLKGDEKSIIIYLFDTGLLGALGNVPEALYDYKTLYTNQITNGLCLNFVASELNSTSSNTFYFWTHNMSKLEFILKKDDNIQPLEVKNDISGKLKSLNVFQKYFPEAKLNRLNLTKPDKKGDVHSYPIYLVKSLYRKFISLN